MDQSIQIKSKLSTDYKPSSTKNPQISIKKMSTKHTLIESETKFTRSGFLKRVRAKENKKEERERTREKREGILV